MRDDVTQRCFHIYTQTHEHDGLSLLTQMAVGELDTAGHYPPGTLLGMAQQRLVAFRRAVGKAGRR